MSSYPISNNSWATKPVLTAGSPGQSKSQAPLRSSPPSQRQDSSHPAPPSPRLLSLLSQTQDVLQVEGSPEDLGRLISHKFDSIDDIRSGFQFAPHQVTRSTASEMDRIQTIQASPPTVPHSHFEIKRLADREHTPTLGNHTLVSLEKPKTLSPGSRSSSKTGSALELPIARDEGLYQGSPEINAGDSLASTFSAAEVIHASIEHDDKHSAENHDVPDHNRTVHNKSGAQDHQVQQILTLGKEPLSQDRIVTAKNQMPVFNQYSSQLVRRSSHEGNQREKQPAAREAQLQQNPRQGIVTDLTFAAPSKPGTSPCRHQRPRSSKAAQSKLPNRPLAKAKPKDPPPRPVSRESNISKRRMPKIQARRKAPSPHLNLKKQVNEHKKGLAYSWNGFFGLERQYTEALECKIDNLKEGIEEYEHIIEQLRAETKTQAHTIEELTGNNSNLREELDIGKERIDEQTLKVQELSEKCREYKKHLNGAIAEQQRLYTKSKRNVQNIVNQLAIEHQALEKSRDDTTRKLLQDSESARETFMAKVNKVVCEARQKNAELNETIAALRTELSERQRELSQERGNTENIRSELEKFRQSDAQTLQALASQNTKILDAIEEGRRVEQDTLKISKDQASKLDSLVQSLEDLKSQVSSQTAVVDEVATARQDITKTVMLEVQKLDSRVSGISKNDSLVDTKIREIMDLCQGIDECLKSNDGALHWQQKYQEIDNQMREAVSQRDAQIDAAQEAMEANLHFFNENTGLKSQVTSLERQVNELQREVQAARDSQSADTDRLERLLAEKDISIKDLETKLKENEATCKEQGDALSDAEVDRARLQQAVETAYKQRDQSISESIRKETRLLQEKHRDAEQRLTVSDEARAKLEEELRHAKDQVQQLSTDQTDNLKRLLSEDIRRINQLISSFTAVRVEMEGMGPISQWIESRAQLEDQHQILKRDFDHACQIRDKCAEMVTTDEAQIQLLRVQLQDGSETQALGGIPDHGPSPSAAPSLDISHARRVVIRSPVEQDIPLAPSVFEERENRRTAQPLKSSIRVTRRVSKELSKEAEGPAPPSSAWQEAQKKQKPELTIHSSFNRPVQGMHKRRQEEPATTVPVKRLRPSDLITKSTGQNRQTRSMSVRIRGVPGEEEELCELDTSRPTADGLAEQALRASEATYGHQDPMKHNSTCASSAENRTFSHGSDASQDAMKPSDTDAPTSLNASPSTKKSRSASSSSSSTASSQRAA